MIEFLETIGLHKKLKDFGVSEEDFQEILASPVLDHLPLEAERSWRLFWKTPMPEIRLIGLDLDGTLLRKDNSVSDENISALQECIKQNIRYIWSADGLTALQGWLRKIQSIRKGDFL